MGVSQSRSVMDLLPASGSPTTTRSQSSSNQTMFDIALKSASAAMPQASGVESGKKKEIQAVEQKSDGKPVPQDGKDVPERRSSAERSDNDRPVARQVSGVHDHEAGKEITHADEAYSQPASQDDLQSSALSVEAVTEAEASEGALNDGSDSSDAGGDGQLNALLQDLNRGDLSPDELLSKLTEVMKAEGISLEDLRDFVTENEVMTSEQFDQLLQNPEAFLTQLQQWLKPGSDSAELLSSLGITKDVAARISAAINQRLDSGRNAQQLTLAEVFKSEAQADSADDLVSRLLKEQGAGKDQDSGFDRDKLFEQLLAQKGSDSAATSKVSGFAGLSLKEFSGNFGVGTSAAIAAGAAVGASGAEGAHGLAQREGIGQQAALPQLPVLRGLPGQAGATEALNERIMMMRSKGLQVAEIRLDPPDLGSLEVRVRVSGDTTSIQFHSPNPTVREALEAQVNRLREMMEESGINLGHVGVSDQSLSERSEEAYASGEGDSVRGDVSDLEDGLELMPESLSVRTAAPGLVDYFA